MKLRIGHSPDPDDAFMVWAFHAGVRREAGVEIELVPRDIETLNGWAVAGRGLEVSALSAATYARVADQYRLLPHGASFGDGYGPIVVAKTERPLDGLTIASPGKLTTAHATLQLVRPGARTVEMPFDEILPAVQRGDVDAGLLIHEGQITWAREGVANLLDLGVWWKDQTGLPLPLGVNALRRDVPEPARVSRLLRAAIEDGLARRAEALQYARGFGRGLPTEDADRFVAMYVNELTRDMGARGLDAVREWMRRAGESGLVPKGARVELAPS